MRNPLDRIRPHKTMMSPTCGRRPSAGDVLTSNVEAQLRAIKAQQEGVTNVASTVTGQTTPTCQGPPLSSSSDNLTLESDDFPQGMQYLSFRRPSYKLSGSEDESIPEETKESETDSEDDNCDRDDKQKNYETVSKVCKTDGQKEGTYVISVESIEEPKTVIDPSKSTTVNITITDESKADGNDSPRKEKSSKLNNQEAQPLPCDEVKNKKEKPTPADKDEGPPSKTRRNVENIKQNPKKITSVRKRAKSMQVF